MKDGSEHTKEGRCYFTLLFYLDVLLLQLLFQDVYSKTLLWSDLTVFSDSFIFLRHCMESRRFMKAGMGRASCVNEPSLPHYFDCTTPVPYRCK
jgi:hypothetical protein